jgi:hypothetical protein
VSLAQVLEVDTLTIAADVGAAVVIVGDFIDSCEDCGLAAAALPKSCFLMLMVIFCPALQ